MHRGPLRLIMLVGISMWPGQSCSPSRVIPDFFSAQSPEGQRSIGEYYRKEAIMFRQKADETAERAAAYQQLFGEESDWVAGTRLLGQFYRQEAQERERLAEQYQFPSEERASSTVLPRKGTRNPK